jgi:hypothetical protein
MRLADRNRIVSTWKRVLPLGLKKVKTAISDGYARIARHDMTKVAV